MASYELIKQVVEVLEDFEQNAQNQPLSIHSFRNYLNEQYYRQESPKNIAEQLNREESTLDNELCKQLLMMGRYAKIALRKGLVNHQELINEDFTYLYRLSDYPQLTKMQLIEKNAHDKQYGLTIIKRLLQNGLIDEKVNENDRREKFIYITAKGKDLVRNSYNDVSRTAKLVSGNLNLQEKQQLLSLLKKLGNFHQFLYEEHRETPITELEPMFMFN